MVLLNDSRPARPSTRPSRGDASQPAPVGGGTRGWESAGDPRTARYEPPTVQVISLSCEISSYAPDERDWPLF